MEESRVWFTNLQFSHSVDFTKQMFPKMLLSKNNYVIIRTPMLVDGSWQAEYNIIQISNPFA